MFPAEVSANCSLFSQGMLLAGCFQPQLLLTLSMPVCVPHHCFLLQLNLTKTPHSMGLQVAAMCVCQQCGGSSGTDSSSSSSKSRSSQQNRSSNASSGGLIWADQCLMKPEAGADGKEVSLLGCFARRVGGPVFGFVFFLVVHLLLGSTRPVTTCQVALHQILTPLTSGSLVLEAT